MKITRGGPEWRLLLRKLNELTGGEAAILNFVLLHESYSIFPCNVQVLIFFDYQETQIA